ncbi:MAG: phosphoglucomutase, alpha-D-glucose phosphate-specific, partial [Phycisphaerae bacterium]|nr:phosphoglucomutase, alpha-D-glucose phosphate-specific [Phycisphaerae bacterium]HAW95703.1 phosphoglucomutase, alpha-D-glucose phosphate-specific [Phycisphaerales bacterium]
MAIHELAGRPVPVEMLIDIHRLRHAYESEQPDCGFAAQRVAFGTSGHRGTPEKSTFTRAHILAITQAICDYRRTHGIDGPLLMAMDTHALSEAAHETALEVLLANDVTVQIQRDRLPTPTPVLSHAILEHNAGRTNGLADGIIITPSHNPPEDGGFKYNGVDGGPANTTVTSWIERHANEILEDGNRRVRISAKVDGSDRLREVDFHHGYIERLGEIL